MVKHKGRKLYNFGVNLLLMAGDTSYMSDGKMQTDGWTWVAESVSRSLGYEKGVLIRLGRPIDRPVQSKSSGRRCAVPPISEAREIVQVTTEGFYYKAIQDSRLSALRSACADEWKHRRPSTRSLHRYV